MIRAFKMRLEYGMGPEFEKRHAEVWPEVEKMTRENRSDAVPLRMVFHLGLSEAGESNTDDPQFRKPAKGDWRLKATSPAVNAGVWCDWMDGATDLLGNPRKVLDNPDIGCYECPCSGLMLLVR